jgi:predicted transcriptional regulator
MAEAIGMLGGAAAALQIAAMLLAIANKMGKHYKTMRNALADVEDIEMHIRIYSNNLTQCHDLSTQALDRMNAKGQDTHARITQLQDLARQGEKIRTGAQRLLKKIKTLKRRKIEEFIRRFRWLFSQSDVVHLRMNLMMASSLLGNFIGYLTWEDLLSRLEECKDTAMIESIHERM